MGHLEGLFLGLLALPMQVPLWPGHQDRQAQVIFVEGLGDA